MPEKLNFTVDLEDGIFVARCVELDIVTDGLTKEEAFENLKEALDCYFANPDERLERRLQGAEDDA
jgi:predicted RNase H-like HicB family nuclease